LLSTHTIVEGYSIRAEFMASPATQEKEDAKARARFPSTVPARERMILDE